LIVKCRNLLGSEFSRGAGHRFWWPAEFEPSAQNGKHGIRQAR
jgi:hypothetical protein